MSDYDSNGQFPKQTEIDFSEIFTKKDVSPKNDVSNIYKSRFSREIPLRSYLSFQNSRVEPLFFASKLRDTIKNFSDTYEEKNIGRVYYFKGSDSYDNQLILIGELLNSDSDVVPSIKDVKNNSPQEVHFNQLSNFILKISTPVPKKEFVKSIEAELEFMLRFIK